MLTIQLENWLFLLWLAIMVISIAVSVYNISLRIKLKAMTKQTDALFDEAINKLKEVEEKKHGINTNNTTDRRPNSYHK